MIFGVLASNDAGMYRSKLTVLGCILPRHFRLSSQRKQYESPSSQLR
jgi:hypothetical protein